MAPLNDLSYNAIEPILRIFMHNGSVKRKLPSFSFITNSGQIWRAVQNGKKSNLPGLWTVRTSPACNWSL